MNDRLSRASVRDQNNKRYLASGKRAFESFQLFQKVAFQPVHATVTWSFSTIEAADNLALTPPANPPLLLKRDIALCRSALSCGSQDTAWRVASHGSRLRECMECVHFP